MQAAYPLRALLCRDCGLLQLEAAVTPDAIFADYPYFSSISQTLLAESARFAEAVTSRLGIIPGTKVVEVASNDGYLLQFFQARGMDVLGVEPAGNVAARAVERGIPTLSRFFSQQTACEVARTFGRPSLLVANNVLAHVPDPNDFIAGLRVLLAPGGTLTVEFHHLLQLVERGQFDNIYHEHFQYFSLAVARRAMAHHGLRVIDVEEIPAQGGSLRLYARHADEVAESSVAPSVDGVLERERVAHLDTPDPYHRLAGRIATIRRDLLAFLHEARDGGQSVACFGAAAKGNTLLNYCGVDTSLITYAVDSSPHKQGLLLPGSRIPVRSPEALLESHPDYLLVLPWNLLDEITAQMAGIRQWGGRFVVAVPELRVLS